MVPKIYCLYHLNICHNLLDIARKRQVVMRMKVDRNKGICSDFVRNVLDGCIDEAYAVPTLGYALFDTFSDSPVIYNTLY